MTTLLTEDFEGGTNGTTATSTNTAFSDASTGTPTFDTSQFDFGTRSCLFNPSAATEFLQHSWTAGATAGLRFYFYVPTLPAANTFLAGMQSTTTLRAQIRLNTDGTLTLRNNVTAVASTTATVSTNTWYRAEWILDNGAGTQALRLYLGNSGTALSGGDISGTYNQGTINRLLLGVVASGTLTYFGDAVKLVDTATFTDLGPASVDATATPSVVAAVATVNAPTVVVPTIPWVNRTANVAARNGTTGHTFSFTAASAGNLLVLVVSGPVTSTTPTGWTLTASAINNTGLYVFSKTASASESSASTTHNGSNFPVEWVCYEFASGASISGTAGTGTNQGDSTWSTVTSLPGTAVTVFGTGNRAISTGATASVAFTSPWIEDVDTLEAFSGNDGAYLAVGYQSGVTATSATPVGAITATSGLNGERATFAVSIPSSGNATPTPSAVAAVTTVPAPVLSTGEKATPSIVGAVASMFTPAVSTGGTNATPTPGVVNGISTVLAMDGQASSAITTDVVSAVAAVLVPQLFAAPARVQATTSVFAPAQVVAIRNATASAVMVLAAAQILQVNSSDLLAPAETVSAFATVGIPRVVTVSPVYTLVTDFGGTFTPPDPGFPRSMATMTTVPVGSTLLRIDGVWVVTVFPSEAMVNSADRVYRGGRRYPLNALEAAELTDAGFGSHIQLELQ